MGRHVISVTITGNSRDLDRALASASANTSALRRAFTKLSDGQSDLDRKLARSARAVNSLGAAIRRTHGDVPGLGTELEKLAKREVIRIKTIDRIDRARNSLARLRWIALAGVGALGAFNLAAAATVGLFSALSGLIVGGAGGGLVYLFGRLWASTDKAKEALQELGNYIRDDLMNRTMKGFYDLMDKLPSVLRKSYEGARGELKKLGEALEPLLEMIYQAMPDLAKEVAKVATVIAKVSKPFFKEILDGLPHVIRGFKEFFGAFKNNENAADNLRITLRTLGDWIGKIGRAFADIETEDLKWAFKTIEDVVSKLWNSLKTLIDWMKKADAALEPFGLSVGKLAAGFIALSFAAKLLGPVFKAFDWLWKAKNFTKTEEAVTKLTQSQSQLSKAAARAKLHLADEAAVASTSTGIFSKMGNALKTVGTRVLGVVRNFSKFVKVAGWIGLVVTALSFIADSIADIRTEGTWLNGWFKWLTNNPVANALKEAWNDFSEAVSEAWSTLQQSWAELDAELEASGIKQFLSDAYEMAKRLNAILITPMWLGVFAVLTGVLKGATAAVHLFSDSIKVIKYLMSDWIRKIQETIDWIKGLFNSTGEAKQGVTSNLNAIQGPFKALSKVAGTVSEAFQTWKQNVTNITQNAKDKLIEIWNAIKERLGNIVDGIRDRIRNVWDSIRDRVREINDALRDKVREIWDAMRDKIKDILNSIKDFVREKWDAVRDKVREINDAIRDKVREIWDAMRDKVRDILSSIREFVREKWDAIRDKVREVNDAIRDKVREIWDSVRDNIRDKIAAAVDIVREKMGNMLEAVKDKVAAFIQAGKDLMMGLANGIRQGGVQAVAAIAGVAIEVVNKAKGLFRIGSPSKLFHQYGLWIGDGLAGGITKSEMPVSKAVDSLASLVTMDNASLSSLWEQEVAAAKKATDQLRIIWGTWASDYTKTINGIHTQPVLVGSGGGTTVIENRTYNINYTSNSPNAGKDIVNEIQKYERVNGRSWRQ